MPDVALSRVNQLFVLMWATQNNKYESAAIFDCFAKNATKRVTDCFTSFAMTAVMVLL
jgi:hypothetical protein